MTRPHFLLVCFTGWRNRHQRAVIEYVLEENRILLGQLRGELKRFTRAQSIPVARKAKNIGRLRLR